MLHIAVPTFSESWEWENYAKAGEIAGYAVIVHEFRITTIDDIQICAARNKHGVPLLTIAKMCLEFDKFDGAHVLLFENGGDNFS